MSGVPKDEGWVTKPAEGGQPTEWELSLTPFHRGYLRGLDDARREDAARQAKLHSWGKINTRGKRLGAIGFTLAIAVYPIVGFMAAFGNTTTAFWTWAVGTVVGVSMGSVGESLRRRPFTQ